MALRSFARPVITPARTKAKAFACSTTSPWPRAWRATSWASARVLIVDWDLHHGQGTQYTFYDDPTVMYFSTHQWGIYPGTGIGARPARARREGRL